MSPPTAKLPLELECEIFETAAWSCREDSQLRLNLSLVARRVHVWSERIFLQVVTLQDGTHAEKFLQLVDWKLTGFFANVVRALFIPYSVTAENASKILSACPGVRILACWVNYWSAPELPLLISRLPLSRLKIELRHFLSIPLDTSAWRSTLTHLDLTFWRHADDPPDLSCLGKLLRLTHVTLANPPPQFAIKLARGLCSNCPNLQMARLDYEVPEEIVCESEDPRIFVKQELFHNIVTHWLEELP